MCAAQKHSTSLQVDAHVSKYNLAADTLARMG